jgi:hypothetical protein
MTIADLRLQPPVRPLSERCQFVPSPDEVPVGTRIEGDVFRGDVTWCQPCKIGWLLMVVLD